MTAIRLRRLYLCLLIFASTQVSADPRVVRLGFDDYCPYCCTQGSRKGFVIDALEKILDQMNKTHQYQDLIREYLPDLSSKESR